MANFKKLGEVTLAENASDSANVLIEESGEIKRVPKTEVGGGGGIKTAIIKDSAYDEMMSYLSGESSNIPDISSVTYSCTNMSFEEANQIFKAGEVLDCVVMVGGSGCIIYKAVLAYTSTFILITFGIGTNTSVLYWTADGISTDKPSA